MMDHPTVNQIQRTGYPNIVAQPEHAGIDYFGDEILVGDDIVEYDGEIILRDNLERYLKEVMEFEFKTA
ncbi:YqaI family protein [Cytobacillus oceanisediminis]|uniref:YqaI family protein n=1 Tax=Cytobacillus oceanisediminis TaxID=665099 RepID=UPI00338E9422